MRAFLLAAGRGTRLRPLTDGMPKCLVPIAGRPLLGWWLDLLARHHVHRVLINTHHLPNQVERFVEGYPSVVDVTLRHEPELLGSAGTIRANWDFIETDEPFLVLYADNLTDAHLGELAASHRSSHGLATIAVFRTDRPQDCGIVSVAGDGIVVDFVEKPSRPQSRLAFAGMMAASPELVDEIPEGPCDLAGDVLPRLVGRMSAWEVTTYLRDVGSPAAYELAQVEAREILGVA